MTRRPTVESSELLSPDAALAASRKACAALDAKYQRAEQAGTPVSLADQREDITRLGKLICRALTGYADVPAGLPRPLAAVLQKAVAPQNAPFKSTRAFHAALTQAVMLLPPDQRTRPLLRPYIRSYHKQWIALTAASLIGLLLLGCFAYVGLAIPAPPILTATALALLPTMTPFPTDTPTATPTATLTPSPTPTATDTYTPTITHTPTASDTPTPIPTLTLKPAATRTLPDTLTAASTESPVVSATTIPAVAAGVVNPCVVVVGDSVAHGGMVFEIPAIGYVHGVSAPLSQFIEQEFQKVGITTMRGVDRAVSNTGISSRNHSSYFRTASYLNLLDDHCRYTIMLPWVNDITSGWPPAFAAPHHAAALVRLVAELADGNPGGRILVLNYYHPVLAPFALKTWAAGFVPENIDAYNREIELSCQYGTLSKLSQVICVHIDDAFTEMGNDHVIGWITHDELNTDLIAPIPEEQQTLLQQYYEVHPDGLILGDGVHLSTLGKSALAAYLVSVMRALPDMPAKVN